MVKVMKRTDLDVLKEKHAKGQGKKKRLDREALRRELIDYYKSEAGHRELKAAPRVTVEHQPNFPLQDQPVEVIVDMIMQEFD